MRRKLLPLLSLALLLGLVAGPRAAEDEVKSILTRAIKAHGGEELLTKYKAGQSKAKGKLKLPGLGEVEIIQEVSFMLPDKFKETIEFEVANQKVNVVTLANGDKFSIEANGKSFEITDGIKKALEDARQMMKAARLVPLLKDKTYELSPLGEVKVEGKPAVGIRVSAKGLKDFNLFFDKETGLLAKLEFRGEDPMTGKERNEERIILEYLPKNKEGIPLPRKILVKHDGETFLEAETTEAKLLEKLDDSEFQK
jgi:hypothetical protein